MKFNTFENQLGDRSVVSSAFGFWGDFLFISAIRYCHDREKRHKFSKSLSVMEENISNEFVFIDTYDAK